MAIKIGENGITYPDSTTQSSRYDSNEDTGVFINFSEYQTAGTHTWTAPAGCRRVRVIVVGGGGGGSGHCESGGAGGYSEKWIEIPESTAVTVTVGGGSSGAGYYSNRPTGGTTSFGSFLSASGGMGANQNYGHTGGHGGVGHGGDINLRGGGGGGHENEGGHNGAASFFGGGSVGAHHNGHSNNSENHSAPGSGGQGTWTSHSRGRNGRPGAVLIWAFS
jgi:hypothetical protein